MTNPYCEQLGIPVPRLEDVRDHTDANTYALLIVSLLERGNAMTLAEVAQRFEQADVASAEQALRSLKRCRPGRAPVHRTGDLYALDPYHHETDLWAFRLGLRPPKAAPLSVVRDEPRPIPGPDVPMSEWELDEAWREAWLGNWSAQRVAMCVLDATGSPQPPEAVIAAVSARVPDYHLKSDAAQHWRRGAPIRVREDGQWELDREHRHLPSARKAVRDRIEVNRRYASQRGDPVVHAANRRAWERRQQRHATELAAMRRALVHGVFAADAGAVVLLDINERRLETYIGGELETARRKLKAYDYIAGVDVRATLAALAFDPDTRRLGELGPPQKTMSVHWRSRPLKITVPSLIRGSCRIPRGLGDPKKLREHLRRDKQTLLRKRLEKDALALHAYYQYGHLHHAVRVRHGDVDEMLLAPWVDVDEPSLRRMMSRASEDQSLIQVVVGEPPDWSNPWERATYCQVIAEGYDYFLLDLTGLAGIDERDVQLARLVKPGEGHG